MENNNYQKEFDYIRFTCTTFFSRKWQLSILLYLFESPRFFGEILRHHEGLSKKYLSTNLHKLETKGIIKRTVIQDGLVTKVQYSLTEQGQELKPIIDALANYGKKYYANMDNQN